MDSWVRESREQQAQARRHSLEKRPQKRTRTLGPRAIACHLTTKRDG